MIIRVVRKGKRRNGPFFHKERRHLRHSGFLFLGGRKDAIISRVPCLLINPQQPCEAVIISHFKGGKNEAKRG